MKKQNKGVLICPKATSNHDRGIRDINIELRKLKGLKNIYDNVISKELASMNNEIKNQRDFINHEIFAFGHHTHPQPGVISVSYCQRVTAKEVGSKEKTYNVDVPFIHRFTVKANCEQSAKEAAERLMQNGESEQSKVVDMIPNDATATEVI